MNDRDVVTIVRSIIANRGLPLAVLTVAASASGWEIRVRNESGGGVFSISVPDGRPVAVRAAVQNQLEEHVY